MNLIQLRDYIRENAEAIFSRSGGPGGQNVNKLNTKATLRLNLEKLCEEFEAAGLTEAEATRLTIVSRETPTLVIHAAEERSQKVNLERAYSRAEAYVAAAVRIPKKRRPTRPTAASKEKRLAAKRARGQTKQNRGKPDAD
jgi:ribosome-associated protein